ncbi:MAG: aspartate aminotransferase family protein [Planctomycetota bacterium]
MSASGVVGAFDQFVIANYKRAPVVFVKGKGSRLRDEAGKEYLDLFPGWGVNGLGHAHPAVAKAVAAQMKVLVHMPNNFYHPWQGRLAEEISKASFGGKVFFANSGAEANEAAIKLARLRSGGTRFKIITAADSFHGRTMGAISATGQPKYQAGLGPLVPGFVHVPFNDLAAVDRAVDAETGAVMIEPIQGEGGIHVATPEYMKGLRALCDAKGLLLILDEVQTGMGRTGKMFAYQHYDIVPDMMTLAKALGGGVPVGALVATPAVAEFLKPGTHASTFGGNPIACAAGLAVFEVIRNENLVAKAAELGEFMMKRLRKLQRKHKTIVEVRGKGLMIGVELAIPGAEVVMGCLGRGLVINCTHDKVIRFLPALTVKKAELAKGLAIFEEALQEAENKIGVQARA